MPTWDIIDRALSHLESHRFDDAWYALVFRGTLELELKRIFEWAETTEGIVELYPSKGARWLSEVVLELKGSDCMGPCDLVREAMLILETERGIDGRLPGRILNNYMSLKYALDYGDCEDWGIIALAKQIIFMDVRDSDSL